MKRRCLTWMLQNKSEEKTMRATCFCLRRRISSCPSVWLSHHAEWKFSMVTQSVVIIPLMLTCSQTSAKFKLAKTWCGSCTTKDKTSQRWSWRKTIGCYNGFWLRLRTVAILKSSRNAQKCSISVTALQLRIRCAIHASTGKSVLNHSRLSRLVMSKEVCKTIRVLWSTVSPVTVRVDYPWATAQAKRENSCFRIITPRTWWTTRSLLWFHTQQGTKTILWA